MTNDKDDNYYINKIKADIAFINDHMRGVSEDALSQNDVLLDSMMFRLIQISENVKSLSENYRKEHDDIPWVAIFGLRNRIVHNYGNVDLGIVYSTLTKDIPELLSML